MYLPSLNTSCSLPQLPDARYTHTQDGKWACGGFGKNIYFNVTNDDYNITYSTYNNTLSCDMWSSDSGTWIQSHALRVPRIHHVSWDTKDGVYLMGGFLGSFGTGSMNSTELVKKDGSVEDGFSLKYNTRYNISRRNKSFLLSIHHV